MSEGDPPPSARRKPDCVGKLEVEKMTEAKNKIAMQKRHKTMLASEELNAEDHPLVRFILVIHEDCAALMYERRG